MASTQRLGIGIGAFVGAVLGGVIGRLVLGPGVGLLFRYSPWECYWGSPRRFLSRSLF
jgi:hypothetical protein